MADNVTANEMVKLTSWGVPIVAALLGAVAALIGREFVEWSKRPKLQLDFEARDEIKPYIIEQNDDVEAARRGANAKTKCLRLRVYNKGKQVATNCEAKISVNVGNNKNAPVSTSYLHWARRDYLLYTRNMEISDPITDFEKAYAPIDINRDDMEYLEVLRMGYWYKSSSVPSNTKPEFVGSASIPAIALRLQSDTAYGFRVTVFSSNATPVSRDFQVKWDGSIDGFNAEMVRVAKE
ncbi:MAG: hypothetical protein HY665_06380 [Chloroflexi bacterium]|nr:hypothetical protein [Chloroflexota bacterium]